MKYTEAWASVMSQNSVLKSTIVGLSLATVLLSAVTIRLSFKEPIVVERGCFTSLANLVSSKHDMREIEYFLREALSQRFDSKSQPVEYLIAMDELALRTIEQKDLQNRNMTQRVLVNSIAESEDGFKVDADRFISVGDIRSGFKFPLFVKVESVARSLSNPYGLILTTIKTQESSPAVVKEKK